MKLKFDYLSALECQCDAIISGDISSSRRKFTEICKNLVSDFLPPIEREDIAALSYSLYDIACSGFREKKNVNEMKKVINGIFTKRKNCGEDFRRQIDNINDDSSAVKNFYKIALFVYFKNL